MLGLGRGAILWIPALFLGALLSGCLTLDETSTDTVFSDKKNPDATQDPKQLARGNERA